MTLKFPLSVWARLKYFRGREGVAPHFLKLVSIWKWAASYVRGLKFQYSGMWLILKTKALLAFEKETATVQGSERHIPVDWNHVGCALRCHCAPSPSFGQAWSCRKNLPLPDTEPISSNHCDICVPVHVRFNTICFRFFIDCLASCIVAVTQCIALPSYKSYLLYLLSFYIVRVTETQPYFFCYHLSESLLISASLTVVFYLLALRHVSYCVCTISLSSVSLQASKVKLSRYRPEQAHGDPVG